MKERNKFSTIFPYVIIAGLIVVIMFMKGCFDEKETPKTISIGGKDYEVVKHEIDTFYKTEVETIYKKGKDIVHEIEVVKEIPANVDTAAILKNYYSKVFYKDTFKLKDTLGFITINDTITENKIAGRKIHTSINVPIVKETLYLKEISNSWFVGPSLQVGSPISIGADLHLKSKKEMLFGLGAGVNTNASPYLRGSVSWKINK